MSKSQIVAVMAVTAWIAFNIGRRSAAASAAIKPAGGIAVVDQQTWDWLSAVGKM